MYADLSSVQVSIKLHDQDFEVRILNTEFNLLFRSNIRIEDRGDIRASPVAAIAAGVAPHGSRCLHHCPARGGAVLHLVRVYGFCVGLLERESSALCS